MAGLVSNAPTLPDWCPAPPHCRTSVRRPHTAGLVSGATKKLDARVDEGNAFAYPLYS